MKTKTKALIALSCLILTIVTIFGIGALAQTDTDAMVAIHENLSDYQVGQKVSLATDNYIGIPVELTVYYNKGKGKATPGYNGTDAILYVVNADFVRNGTKSDTEIIGSMLDRGMVVTVLDYKNHKKATGADLDWSAQSFIGRMKGGEFYQDPNLLPSGSYNECFLVPSGCDILTDMVIWEIDKHSSVGTMERIVYVWNTDFRGPKKGDTIIKWVHEDGTKKATQNAPDGTAPVWYTDANGSATSPDGEYIRVKHTLAETITDCVKADGSPIDLNIYMHVVYPTNPVNDVPVMTMACSSEHLAAGAIREDRPHINGFLFEGYATANYDYAYVPMARDDHYGYFAGDSDGAMTGENGSYGVFAYNNNEAATSAMRAIRHLAASDHETYAFDSEHIGILGNSKGSSMTFLGDPAWCRDAKAIEGLTLEECVDAKITSVLDFGSFLDEVKQTRYHAGHTETYTKDGVTIDGGELQPWLTYNGKELMSGAQFVYSSCGAVNDSLTEDFAPLFIAAHMYSTEASGWRGINSLINLTREMDIPALWFEVEWNHNFVPRHERNYGIDPYVHFKQFANYYLRGDAIGVSLMLPQDKSDGVSVSSEISLKFLGSIEREEVEKIRITSKHGTVSGTWSSQYGNTEWIFTPDFLTGSTDYTVRIPKGIVGDNGVPTDRSYAYTFRTEEGRGVSLSDESIALSGGVGTYFSMTVPSYETEKTFDANAARLRLNVTSDAANVLTVYKANSASSHTAEVIETIYLRGAGYYDVNLSTYFAEKLPGSTAYVYVEQKKAAATTVVYNETFTSSLGDSMCGDYAEATLAVVNGESMYCATLKPNHGQYGANDVTYGSRTVLKNSALLGSTVSSKDTGRRFVITFDIYDTISRDVSFSIPGVSDRNADRRDYQIPGKNVKTVPGEKITVTLEYTVYEYDYGVSSVNKYLTVTAQGDGILETPIYFDNLTVTEYVTDAVIGSAELFVTSEGDYRYKASGSEHPIYIGEVGYDDLSDAVTAAKNGDVIALRDNYVMDSSFNFGKFTDITLDLGGYTIRCEHATSSLLTLPAISTKDMKLTVKNGVVLLGKTPLISYNLSTQSGKKYDITLENLKIFAQNEFSATSFIGADSSPRAVDVSITLRNCDLSLPNDALSRVTEVTVFPSNASKGLSQRYSLEGGSIKLTSFARTPVYSVVDAVVFDKENPTTLLLSNAAKIHDLAYLRSDSMARFYMCDEYVGEYYTSYRLGLDELYTPYGVIPEKYVDENKYPIVLFNPDFSFVLATDRFAIDNDRGSAIGIATHTNPTNYVAYLRRDYVDTSDKTHWNLAMLNGTWTMDLGGHTFTVTDKIPFILQGKAKENLTHKMIFKNGTMQIGPTTLISYQPQTSAGHVYDMIFENITFKLKSATVPSPLIASMGASDTPMGCSLTLRDCVVDVRGATDPITLFTLGTSKGNMFGAFLIEGGELLTDDPSTLKITELLGTDIPLNLHKGKNGEYLKLTCPSGIAIPTYILSTPDGLMSFDEGKKLDDTHAIYSLTYNDHATIYGLIPDEFFDEQKYPVVVFDKLMNFLGAYESLVGDETSAFAACAALLKAKTEPILLLRRDLALGEYTNMATDLKSSTAGTYVTLDLDGYTLSSANGSYLFNLEVQNYNYANLRIQNGTITVGEGESAFLLTRPQSGNTTFNVVLDSVSVNCAADASDGALAAVSLEKAYAVKFNLTLLDCDIAALGATDGSKTSLFVNDAESKAITTFKIYGGYVYADTADRFAFTSFVPDSKRKLLVGQGSAGKFPIVYLCEDANAPAGDFTTEDGTALQYAKVGTDGAYTAYSLGFTTPYGVVPVEYSDIDLYPFFVFDGEGRFIGASNSFAEDNNPCAMSIASGVESGMHPVILFRKDFTYGNYNNLTYVKDVTIDLGGFTLAKAPNSTHPYIFKAQAKYSGNRTELTVKNGTITVASNQYLVYCLADKQYAGGSSYFGFRFEDVTIRRTKDNKNTNGLLWSPLDSPIGYYEVDMTFTDCTLDYSYLNADTPTVLFGSVVAGQTLTATFIGGTIHASTLENQTFFDLGGVQDASVTFKKNAEGEYTTLVLPSEATPPTATLPTEEGEAVYEKSAETGEEGESAVYTLFVYGA